jgi:ABC-type Fe3+-hydroxamate transport system substrate-binding protein
MSIRVTLACGCSFEVDGKSAPVCGTHQESRVQSVKAPPPRIVATGCTATGPLVVPRG